MAGVLMRRGDYNRQAQKENHVETQGEVSSHDHIHTSLRERTQMTPTKPTL